MTDEPQEGNLHQLWTDLREMEECELYQQLLAFDDPLYIFDENFSRLRKIVNFLESGVDRGELLRLRNRDKLETLQRDIMRRLHNFVAAAQSLIDHTRRLYNKLYSGSSDFSDYQERIKRDFDNDPLSRFVKGLRQYCLHYRAPGIGFRVKVTRGDEGLTIETRKVFLSLGELRTFDGWNATAKRYMDTLGRDVPLLEVITAYREKVINFYRWFQSRQSEIHAPEIERFESKQAEYVLRILEFNINACFNTERTNVNGEELLFEEFLSSEEYDELEKLPPDSPRRASYAIERFEKRFPLTDELRQRIQRLYQEPHFQSWLVFPSGKSP
jgi:hypothetical protein